MITTSREAKTKPTQETATLTIGADIGAGLTKLVITDGSKQIRFRAPSKLAVLLPGNNESFLDKNSGHFFYESGAKKDLSDYEIIFGEAANQVQPDTHIKLSDDPALKAEYALECLLGALSSLSLPTLTNINICISTHNPGAFRTQIITSLSGKHTISLGGQKSNQRTINIESIIVAPEGAGAYFNARSLGMCHGQRVVGLDFGTSTIIPSIYSPQGKLVQHLPLSLSGTVSLLESIAQSPELIEFVGTGKPANTETIRQAIESRSWIYRKSDRKGTRELEFSGIYKSLLKPWLTDRIRLAFRACDKYTDQSRLLAWGGGTEMPYVAQMLEQLNIECLAAGGWANAIGLNQIALAKLGGN